MEKEVPCCECRYGCFYSGQATVRYRNRVVRFTWNRVDQDIPARVEINGSELIIPQINPEDSGTYECVGTIGSISGGRQFVIDVKG